MKKTSNKNKKERSNRLIFLLIFILMITALATVVLYYGFTNYTVELDEGLVVEKKIKIIKKHYGPRVVLKTDADIYEFKDGKYLDVGDIAKSYYISLEEIEIDEKTLYFPIKDTKYFVKYDKVKISEGTNDFEDYNYILFNQNVISKKGSPLYQNNKEVLRFDNEKSYPILIKEDDHYIVKYNDEYFMLKKTDAKEVVDHDNTDLAAASSIPVLNYHFLYNPKTQDYCPETICLNLDYFYAHLNYLKENNYYTLTMKDMALWMDKKIRTPEKSVIITFDDGTNKTDQYLAPALEKYELHGVLFLVTSWFNYKSFDSPYLEVQSHGHELHGVSSRVTEISRMTVDELDKDFKNSIKSLDGEDTAFCYPYYYYNAKMLEAVEDNFDIAFVGGNRRARQSDNKYLIPRIVIYSHHNLNYFIQLIK